MALIKDSSVREVVAAADMVEVVSARHLYPRVLHRIDEEATGTVVDAMK